jgi:lipooligosaccharide transport system permease protein
MSESTQVRLERRAPSVMKRVVSVWFRHYRVYMDTFVANATPAVLEPVFFLLAVGLGVGRFVKEDFVGLDFASFMAPGILAMTCVYTASFETTYGTFVRMRFQQTYDAMRATPLTVRDIFAGELLWCATKGALFGTIVGLVLLLFGKVLSPYAVLVPALGFLTALAFGGLSLTVTSLVANMNHFQFYFTIGLTPLVFFSGLMFPVDTLPPALETLAYSLPMFHVIESFRLVVSGPEHVTVTWAHYCPLVLIAMAGGLSWLGVSRMVKRMLKK